MQQRLHIVRGSHTVHGLSGELLVQGWCSSCRHVNSVK
jgi:hypothetical protein